MSMIGKKIKLRGFGVYHNDNTEAIVKKITKTQVVLQYGTPDPKNPHAGTLRYRLSDGYSVGAYSMSGHQVPPEDLVELRKEVPGGYRATATTQGPTITPSSVTGES